MRRGGDPDTPAPVDLDIRVRLSSAGNSSRLDFVLHSPSGVAAFHYKEVAGPEIVGGLDAYQRELVRQLQRLYSGRDVDDSVMLQEEVTQRITSIGRRLYVDLFTREMREAYKSFRDSVRTIQVTSDEPWIPWELIKPYDNEGDGALDDDFLCVQFEMTRWLAGRRNPRNRVVVRKLAFFGAGDQLPLPYADAERELFASMASSRSDIEDLTPDSATFENITGLLAAGGIDLIHFISPTSGEEGDPGLLLADGRSLRASDLLGPLQKQLARDRPFVFLNFTPIRDSSFAGLAGWASQWIKKCGSGAFIGPLWALRDASAYEFAEEFYKHLLNGSTLGEATNRARQHLRMMRPGDPSFLAYSAYGHPNALVVFVVAAEQEHNRDDRAETPEADSGLITRSIEFQPEHYQAGLTILSYFSTVVRQKYPGKKVKIRIEQEGMVIRMVIDTPEGIRDELEETLEGYGLVVQGQKAPRDLLKNEFEVAELRHQLRLANVQLESQKELYALVQDSSRERMGSLEKEVKWLRSHVGTVLSLSEKHIAVVDASFREMLDMSGQAGETSRAALALIREKLLDGLKSADEEDVKEALSTIRAEDRRVFDSVRSRFEELIVKGSISGVSGNLLYEWIKAML